MRMGHSDPILIMGRESTKETALRQARICEVLIIVCVWLEARADK